MNSAFEFATAGRVIFGAGKLALLGGLAAELGRRPLLVTGAKANRARPAEGQLLGACEVVVQFPVAAEPTIELVEHGARLARDESCDLVVGFGGGSVIDAAKAIAALATNPGAALRYLEVIGEGRPLEHPPLPFIAIPTTAGTGAEMTRNAVLHSPEHRLKASLRSPLMLPRIALVDPETTLTVPPPVTAATGMDALTQLIEPFLSCRANPLTDALCRQAIPLVARSIEPAMQDGDNLAARTELALGSMFSGMALANAGLGAVHGLAGPIGGWCGAAHGAICAALLPAVTRVNHEEAVDRNQTTTLERFRVLGRLLGGEADSEDPAASALDWLAQLQRRLSLPGLQALGVARADFAKLAAQSLQSSSMKGNPVKLSEEKLIEILQAAY